MRLLIGGIIIGITSLSFLFLLSKNIVIQATSIVLLFFLIMIVLGLAEV